MAVSREVQTQRCIPCRIRGVEKTAGVVVVVPRRRRRKGEAFPDPAAGSPWTTALSAGGAVQRRSECTSECIGRVARREMTHTRWYCGTTEATWHLKFPSLKHPCAAVLNLSFRTRLLLFQEFLYIVVSLPHEDIFQLSSNMSSLSRSFVS